MPGGGPHHQCQSKVGGMDFQTRLRRQSLDLRRGPIRVLQLWKLDRQELEQQPLQTAFNCYGCTVRAASTYQGALA